MIIQNALVYTPRHTFEKGSIVIREGRIVPFAAPEEGEEVLDAQGLYALPGLVDIHFHGAMGKDFCDGTEEAIQMALEEVKQSRVRFRAASQEQMQAQRAELNRSAEEKEAPKTEESAQ